MARNLLSVIMQTCINFASLYFVLRNCKQHVLPYDPTMERDGDFEPNMLSTGIFLITCTMVLNSFFVNYSGKPHMEPLQKNKLLYYAGLIAYAMYFAAGTGFTPLCELFQLVQTNASDDFWASILKIQVFSTAATFAAVFAINLTF